MIKRALGLGVVAIVLLVATGVADTYYWTNEVASTWSDGFSWSPLGFPTETDIGTFNSNGTYHVTFSGPTTAGLAFSGEANTTFNLAGTTFTHSGAGTFYVNENAQWSITNGTMDNARQLSIGQTGDYATQVARVTVGQAAIWNHNTAKLEIGAPYAGEFILENGGKLDTDPLQSYGIVIGTTSGTGLLKVDGVGSTWTNSGLANSANAIYIANTAGSTGTVTVSNGGVVVHKAGTVNFGYQGLGILNIMNGGTFDATAMTASTVFNIGQGVTGTGEGTITGSDSRLLVGENGKTHTFYLGNSAGGQGSLTIEDGGSMVYKGKNFFVGGSGYGFLTVSNGGLLDLSMIDTGANVYIGNANNSIGEVTVTGESSQFKSSSDITRNVQIIIGSQAGSRGTLNILDSAKVTHQGGNVFIGSSGNGFLNITGGGSLDLREAATGKGLYIGNSGTSAGTVVIEGPNSILWAGKHATTIASTKGAVGSLTIEQGGAFYTSNTVTVANGGTGSLVIRDGGIFRASDAPIISIGYSLNALDSIGQGTMLLTDSNSKFNVGEFYIGSARGTGAVTIANGATGSFYRTMALGGSAAGYTADGTLTVTGTNSVLRSVAPEADQVAWDLSIGVGAAANNVTNWTSDVFYTMPNRERGKGLMIAENGGRIETASRLLVFSNSTVRVDGGQIHANQIGMESNSVFNAVLRLGDANSTTALMTATDQVRIYGATLDVRIGSDFVYNYGDKYLLMRSENLPGGIGFLDMAGNLIEDDTNVTLDGQLFYYSYFAGEEVDVLSLTAIPEPGSFGLIGAGFALATMLRRRRKSC